MCIADVKKAKAEERGRSSLTAVSLEKPFCFLVSPSFWFSHLTPTKFNEMKKGGKEERKQHNHNPVSMFLTVLCYSVIPYATTNILDINRADSMKRRTTFFFLVLSLSFPSLSSILFHSQFCAPVNHSVYNEAYIYGTVKWEEKGTSFIPLYVTHLSVLRILEMGGRRREWKWKESESHTFSDLAIWIIMDPTSKFYVMKTHTTHTNSHSLTQNTHTQ